MSARTRLILASFLMLFLELTLIRWLGANVIHLGYFTNFVLLGSFLGIGLGFLRAGRRPTCAWWPPLVLVSVVALVYVFPVGIDRQDSSVLFFTSLEVSGPPMWVTLPILFVAVAAILVGPAELAAREFKKLPNLTAYRWDLLGSLGGVVIFAGMSLIGAPAAAWGVVVAVVWFILVGPRPPVVVAASIATFGAIMVLQVATPGVIWSPYSKLTVEDVPNGTLISSNNIPHQGMFSVEDKLASSPQYGLPYDRLVDGSVGDVLIIGAGSGSDVAIALERGASSVTAVDIDPRLIELGRQQHPDLPYDDPRVETVVDDGRAFLERTDKTFDLILFALPDSLTLVNGGGGVRLESYLFTLEALEAARARLNEGGGFAMYNYYRETWLVDRLAATALQVFGHEPCVDRIGGVIGEAVLATSLSEEDQQCGSEAESISAEAPPPVTDDAPFVYVQTKSIPMFYLVAVAAIILMSTAMVRLFSGGRLAFSPYRDLFFMGAAFLLLETKSVTTFALLFGTTWFVNAIVFAGILLTVLLAVEVTARIRTPRLPVVYSLLGAALVLAFVVPNAWILGLPVGPRALVACALAFAPIFFANIAFAKRFADSSSSTDAFAINILGAMVGGCMEYLALITGYRSLLIVVGVLYLGAFLLRPGQRDAIPTAPATAT